LRGAKQTVAEENPQETLGSFLRRVLDERGMSANMLATASGVAESTIRNLLKQGEDSSAPGPHPLVLRAICDILGLDHIRIFQMADYIPADYYPTHLSPTAEYVALCFDSLLPNQQQMFLGLLDSLDRSHSLPFDGQKMTRLLQEVANLRQQQPMFRVRKFTAADEVGRIAGKVLRKNPTEHYLVATLKRLNALFEDSGEGEIPRERVEAVIGDVRALVVLNILLPRKEAPTSLEKLYWLLRPHEIYRTGIDTMTEDEQEGCRALWRLLDTVCR
jgi:hypothetical protein